MGLENLKSVFSPTNTKFQDNQSDLSTFPRQFDNNFIQTDLTTFPRQFDDNFIQTDLTTFPRQFDNNFLQTNLQNLNSVFDNGLNLPIQSSVLNLTSIFRDDFESGVDDFITNRVDNVSQTNLFNEPPGPTQFIATNPTDFSTAVGNNESAFTPLSQLGQSALDGLSWEKLYNNDHTPKNNRNHKGIVPISYPNVSRDNLKIGRRAGNIQRYGFERGDEPYVISKIGNNGRTKNSGNRSIPIIRALVDGDRIINYLASPAGLAFVVKQNINVPIENTVIRKNGSLLRVSQRFGVIYNPLSSVLATTGRLLGQGLPNVLFRKQGMGGSDAIAEGLRGWEEFKPGGGARGDANRENLSDLLGNRGDNVYGVGKPNGVNFSIHDSFTKAGDNQAGAGNGILSQLGDALSSLNPFDGGTTVPKTITGDKMTLASMIKGDSLVTDTFGTSVYETGRQLAVDNIPVNIDSAENGMPFYFKDLRDNTYIFFRAYIEGLTENISPSYAPHNYIGRSEPVFVYERAERELSFTLKLVAQTQGELVKIYEKMDRLTSLCYPQYINEGKDGYGNRMKPPLTKFRYGELYGKTNKEQLGYIKSISYSVEETSTYETEKIKKENGVETMARVPRHVTATIGYQVIHDIAPRLGTIFYGINKTDADTAGLDVDESSPGGFQDSSPTIPGQPGAQSFY